MAKNNIKVKNKLQGYPKNLYSLTKQPEAKYLYMRIALLTTLIMAVIIAWYSLHQLVVSKRSVISNIYTLVFTDDDKDVRSSHEQAMLALNQLKEQSFIKDIRIVDNSKFIQKNLANDKVLLPNLMYIQIYDDRAKEFKIFSQDLLNSFPALSINNHNLDNRIIDLKNRYNNFLFTLAICGIIALLTIFLILWFVLRRWLAPHKRTIEIITLIGGNEKNIMDIFNPYVQKNLSLGILIGLIVTTSIGYSSIYILDKFEYINLKMIYHSYITFIMLAILAITTIYTITKLRMYNIFKNYIRCAT